MSLSVAERGADFQQSAKSLFSYRKFWLRGFAPIYFLLFSVMRSYIEMGLLAERSAFSYYTALHHTFWNAATILMIILLMNLILKVPITRLIWVIYGVTLMAIPLVHAVVSGDPLRLEYLRGTFFDIIRHIASFCLTYPRNRPLTIELIVIFSSMLIVGYAYTRSLARAVLLAVSVHILGNIFAIHWFGPKGSGGAIFLIKTQWGHHQFMAVIWLHIFTVMGILFVWRAGWVGENKQFWRYGILIAFMAWGLNAGIIRITGWFVEPCDVFMSGLPVATLAFLSAGFLFSQNRVFSTGAWVTMGIILLLQVALMGPIYFYLDGGVAPKPALLQWLMPE